MWLLLQWEGTGNARLLNGRWTAIILCKTLSITFVFLSTLCVECLAPPTQLTVLELSPTSFTVSWRPPLGEVENGSTLYYIVNVTDTEEESVVLLQHTVNSTILQLRVAELLPNHVHQVSVAAVSGEDTGPAVTVWIRTSAVTAAGKYACFYASILCVVL